MCDTGYNIHNASEPCDIDCTIHNVSNPCVLETAQYIM